MDEGNWQFAWIECDLLLRHSLPGLVLVICSLFVRHRGVAFALAFGALSATATQALRSILWLPLMFLLSWNDDQPTDVRRLALTIALTAPPIAIALLALWQLMKIGLASMQPVTPPSTENTHPSTNHTNCAKPI
jgi:hypothetical protein